jgi:mRNA interferase RelE/StbE
MQPEFPPDVAAVVRRLAPDVRRSVKQAVRALSVDPGLGELLQRDLEGFGQYRVRRFRIVYRIDRTRRTLQVLAVGHRRTVYEAAAGGLLGLALKRTARRRPGRK